MPNYVENEELLEEIIKFKKTKIMSDRLGEMILLIAKRFSTIGKFRNYTWRDDMIADAVLTCVKYCHSFDPKKSTNPHAYITKICLNQFRQYLKKQKKHSTIKDVCVNDGHKVCDLDEHGEIIGLDYEDLKRDA